MLMKLELIIKDENDEIQEIQSGRTKTIVDNN